MTDRIASSFTIRIRKKQEQYTIQALGPNDIVAAEEHPFIWLPTEDQENTLNMLQGDRERDVSRVPLSQLTNLGQSMCQAIFTPSIAIAFGHVQAKLKKLKGIRIRLLIEPPELIHLPWELMHDGHDFIALRSNYPLVRGTKDAISTREIAVHRQLKILYAWATPQDQRELKLQDTAEKIQNLLATNKKIQFDILPDATLTKLRSVLDKGYHILCFAGHGDSAGIYLEKDDSRHSDKISGLVLARVLEGGPTRLVFLAACKTAMFVPSEQMTFGESLLHEANNVKAEVSSVVAMQYDVRDDETNRLTARFFETLASFKPVDAALSEARKSILDEERQSTRVTRDVFAPVMYLQSESSNLFRKDRNWTAIGFAAAFIVAALLGFIALWQAQKSSIGEAEAKATAISEATQRSYAQETAQAESTQRSYAQATAQAEKIRAEEQEQIVLARKLASPAQSLYESDNSEQLLPVLLAVQSMKAFPIIDAAQILQTHTLARPITQLYHDDSVSSVAFSPDGKWLISGSSDGSARVWDTGTWQEISRVTHEDAVNIVIFHPNGKWVASGSDDSTIEIWEAETGHEVAHMSHGNSVKVAAFSPDGKWLISGSSDGTARVWDVVTGKELSRMVHNDGVTSVAFSPDGKWVASGGCDELDPGLLCMRGTARVWEATTGQEIARVDHGDNYVSAIAFSPDGKWVASGGSPWDSKVQVWEASTGQVVSRMNTSHANGIWAIAFSPDGKWVVSGGCDERSGFRNPCFSGSARVWDVITGEEVSRMPHTGEVRSVAFDPDGKLVMSGGDDGIVRVWAADTGREVAQIPHEDIVLSAIFSPDGKLVASAGADAAIRVWNIANDNDVVRVTRDAGFRSPVFFSSNSKWVISDGCAQRNTGHMLPICISNSIYIWDAATGQEISRTSYDDEVNAIAVSPDGEQVVFGSLQGAVVVWRPFSEQEGTRMLHDDRVSTVVFDTNGKWVVSGSFDQTVRVWNVITGQEISRMNHDDTVISIALSPNGAQVLSGSWDKTARLWDLASGKELARLPHDDAVNSVAFSADGKWLLSGSDDSTARVWDAYTGQEISRMTHDDKVTVVAFVPDSEWVVSGSEDGTARVWNAITGKEITRLVHEYGVQSIAVSEDGKWIVSGEMHRPLTGAIGNEETLSYPNSMARVWEVISGREIARMIHKATREGVPNGVRSVAFSPDGRWIVSADSEGDVFVWLYRPEDLIESACVRVSRNLTFAEWREYVGEGIPYEVTCDPNIYPNAIIPEDAQAYFDGQ
ncbi:MAG: CHAT domain-containing protein [Chloroflexota bacterium]